MTKKINMKFFDDEIKQTENNFFKCFKKQTKEVLK